MKLNSNFHVHFKYFLISRKMFNYLFSGYLLVKCPVIHRLMGCALDKVYS